MRFSFAGTPDLPGFAPLAAGLRTTLEAQGHIWCPDPADASLVFNFFTADAPRPFRRRAQAVFVVGVTALDPAPGLIDRAYPVLIRSLSNILLSVDAGADGESRVSGGSDLDDGPHGGGLGLPGVDFLTGERGHFRLDGAPGASATAEAAWDRLRPLATATLVIANVFEPDLPPELHGGDGGTRALGRAGQRLAALDLLPAPFPLDQVLPTRDLKHLKRLYGMGGLSYGNLSVRRDADTFWMSASGVDKSRLQDVGREILLVKGYDPERRAMVLSVPPDVEPRRVSVDAIEHWMIYRRHPDVCAVVHVHAWMDGIESTPVYLPCGTYEMAEAVADIVNRAPDPTRAEVGLKNHGITLTGPHMDDVFQRLEARVQRMVPVS